MSSIISPRTGWAYYKRMERRRKADAKAIATAQFAAVFIAGIIVGIYLLADFFLRN